VLRPPSHRSRILLFHYKCSTTVFSLPMPASIMIAATRSPLSLMSDPRVKRGSTLRTAAVRAVPSSVATQKRDRDSGSRRSSPTSSSTAAAAPISAAAVTAAPTPVPLHLFLESQQPAAQVHHRLQQTDSWKQEEQQRLRFLPSVASCSSSSSSPSTVSCSPKMVDASTFIPAGSLFSFDLSVEALLSRLCSALESQALQEVRYEEKLRAAAELTRSLQDKEAGEQRAVRSVEEAELSRLQRREEALREAREARRRQQETELRRAEAEMAVAVVRQSVAAALAREEAALETAQRGRVSNFLSQTVVLTAAMQLLEQQRSQRRVVDGCISATTTASM
jgi:hypothetical protein